MGKRGRNQITGPTRRRAYEPDAGLASRIEDILAGRSRAAQANQPDSLNHGASSSSAVIGASDSSLPSPSLFQSNRADAPPVASLSRGSHDDAVAAAASDDSKQRALAIFEDEKVARSSRKSRDNNWNVWRSLHRTWFRDEHYLPLTTTKIACVSALFKAGKYCSYANYIGRAKAEHIATYHIHKQHWTEELSVAVRDATRSVLRGLGTARQSSPIDVQKVYALSLSSAPMSPGGPISPTSFAVLGIFFMTREIEITCAGFSDLRLDVVRNELTWRLPVSKTDARALGTTRTWGCVCGGDRSLVCPLHSFLDHSNVHSALAAELGVAQSTLPLFPDQNGKEVSKANAVSTIVQLAARTGEAVTDTRGRQLYGGHSLRTGGAVTLSGLGLDSVRIECLARWHSPMLAHYARLAPLKTLTAEYKSKARDADLRNGTDELADRLSALQLVVDNLVRRLDEEQEKLDDDDGSRKGLYVLNCLSNIWHLSSQHDSSTHAGKTICRWNYTLHNSTAVKDEPFASRDSSFCNRCLPRLSMEAGRVTSRNVASSSDSSSESS